MDAMAWNSGIDAVSSVDERDPVVDDRLERAETLGELIRLAFRVAYSVLKQRQDAEEVAQESILTACRKFTHLRDKDRLRPWLVRIAWRKALDHRRAAMRRQSRESGHMTTAPPRNPEELAVEKQRSERLWQAIDTLPEKLKTPLVLASIEGMDLKTVASALSIPTGTVKSRLYQARKTLMEALR